LSCAKLAFGAALRGGKQAFSTSCRSDVHFQVMVERFRKTPSENGQGNCFVKKIIIT
jgi:hypothetical protein